VTDGNGAVVLSKYEIQSINPFRYRGYYYDVDLDLYLLQSRYYDSNTGRFINADTLDYLDPESINGLNLYCYSMNNPIMYADPAGHSATAIIIALIVGAVVGGIVGAVRASKAEKDGWAFAGSVIMGAFTGAAIAGVIVCLWGAGVVIVKGATAITLGIQAKAAFAIGALVYDIYAMIVNPILGAAFELIETIGTYTPNTPNNKIPLPDFEK
ncbi:MAG: hypothetical protein IKD26_04875, partial [Clostridia bacterium]|nr:hypothetical protein [Clostridia bacterium]